MKTEPKYPAFEVVAKSTPKAGHLIITGYIAAYNENAGAKVKAAFQELEKKHKLIIVNIINCYGGSVYEGMVGFETIKNSSVTTHCIVEGLAASMGSLYPLACDTKEITKLSRGMLHRPMGGVQGDYEKMQEEAGLLKDIQHQFAEEYAEASGKTVDWVQKNWLARGVDKYLNSADMVKHFGFTLSKKPEKLKADPVDASDVESLSMEHMAERYNSAYAALEITDDEGAQVSNLTNAIDLAITAKVNDKTYLSYEAAVQHMAYVAGISIGSVEQAIVGSSAGDPPLDLLEAFSAALSCDLNELIEAAAADGCAYSLESNQSLINLQSMENLPLVIAAMGMPAGSSEADVLAKIKEEQTTSAIAQAKVIELQAVVDGHHGEIVKSKLDAAVVANLITQGEADIYAPMASTPEGLASVEKLIATKKPHVPASQQVEGQGGAGDVLAKYDDWDFTRFRKEAPKVLASIKENDIDRYNQLFEHWKQTRND